MVHVRTFRFQTLSEIQTGLYSYFGTVWNLKVRISDIHCIQTDSSCWHFVIFVNLKWYKISLEMSWKHEMFYLPVFIHGQISSSEDIRLITKISFSSPAENCGSFAFILVEISAWLDWKANWKLWQNRSSEMLLLFTGLLVSLGN